MNKFNLTFRGEVLPGKDPDKARAGFAALFDIQDPKRLEQFFSGKTIILRRNLERKAAAEYYLKLNQLGLEAELVKPGPENDVESTETTQQSGAPQDAAGRKAQKKGDKRLPTRKQGAQDSRTSGADKQRRKREALAQLQHAAAQRKEAAAERERQRIAEQLAKEQASKRAAEETARKLARAEAERQRKAEETARKKAQAAAERQREAEETARKKAEAEAERQRKAEETARKKAQAEAERQRKAEETARKKAQAEAERQRKAEETARKKAEAAAEQQRKAEETARKKAEAEAERQRKAEETARKKAEAAAEQQRKAEETARKKAEAAAEQQRKAEETARKKAEAEAERQRKAEETARKKQKAEAAARRKSEAGAQQQRRPDAACQSTGAATRKRPSTAKPTAHTSALEEKAIEAGARALAGTPSLKRTTARVKSRLELPRRNDTVRSGGNKNPPGSPNPYRLLPFRSTTEIRQRSTIAAQQSRRGVLIGCIALAMLLMLLGRFLSLNPATPPEGPSAIAASSAGNLLILAGDTLLLHNRAGVPTESLRAETLALRDLSGPIAFDLQGDLLIGARAAGTDSSPRAMWRCKLDERSCQPVTEPQFSPPPTALTMNSLTGEWFIAAEERLSKLGSDGELRAKLELPLPTQPTLRLDSGLLFMNSAQAPAISVFRYEDKAFGQQLDEILLLPPPALQREQTRVGDFIRNGDFWWVNMHNPDTETAGLYLFDRDWTFIRELPRGAVLGQGQLVNWGERVLLFSDQQESVLRFSRLGQTEVPLQSESLAQLIDQASGQLTWTTLAWQATLLLLLLSSLGGFSWAYLQSTRALVYSSRPTHGAPPLDDVAEDIHWLQSAPHRTRQWRQRNIAWAALAIACLIVLIGLGVSLVQLMAAAAALAGFAVALQIMLRSEPEHAGLLAEQLVLADHREMYHLATGPRIHYRGPFVVVDDVIIFTGNKWFPGLHQQQVKRELEPRVTAGVRVDRKTIAVKLLQSRHPVAKSGIAIAVGAILGALLLAISFLPWQG